MNSRAPKKIVVMISGSGTNLQAIIDGCTTKLINGEVVAVISNKPDVYGLERARKSDIPAISLLHTDFDSREEFDTELANRIHQYKPDLVVLAGFMRILSPNFVQQFAGKMLNIHPSLLPKYPGLNTHQRAIDNGDKYHGASIHFVTAELDGGPVVIQSQISIDENDTSESLAKRVAVKEWLIYPLVVSWFCDDRLHLEKDLVWFDGKRIRQYGILYEKLLGENPLSP